MCDTCAIFITGEPVEDYGPEEVYTCPGCFRVVCFCNGAADQDGEFCDDCANKREQKREALRSIGRANLPRERRAIQ